MRTVRYRKNNIRIDRTYDCTLHFWNKWLKSLVKTMRNSILFVS